MAKQVNVAHILVDSEREAEQIKDLLDGGEEFGALASERSSCPSADAEGELGWCLKADLDEDFAAAAFALGEGEVSEPVQSAEGWHIILLHAKK